MAYSMDYNQIMNMIGRTQPKYYCSNCGDFIPEPHTTNLFLIVVENEMMYVCADCYKEYRILEEIRNGR